MRFTDSLKSNRDFRRLYRSGKQSVQPFLVVYYRKNPLGSNRLGITVSTKIGKAVVRNRIRRRLREIYRLNEEKILPGIDIIVVARHRSVKAGYAELEDSYLKALRTLELLKK